RGLTNERGEFLITTLPVADLSVAAGSDAILFPYYADGGGWLTHILLVNTTDNMLNGSLQFSGSSTPSPYTVAARSSFQLLTSGIGSSTTTGSIRLTPATGTKTPVGVAVFSFKNAGVTVSEAGVQPVAASNAVRMYAESAGSVQTGLAITNPSASAAAVTF